MTRKGSLQNDWTSSEVAYLRRYAGKVPRRELQYTLKRSASSIEHMARRLGLSLRVPIWHLNWCNECANWRSYISPKTGRCKVCQVRSNLAKEEARCVEVYQRMSLVQRVVYDESEVIRGRRKQYTQAPKAPSLQGLSAYQASKAQQVYCLELEAYQLESVQGRYDACRKRLERMRAVLKENPRKKI